MAGITLAQAEAQLQVWLDASTAVARNQSYSTPDGRSLSRADAKEIRANIRFWDDTVKDLDPKAASARVRLGVPRT